jgi:hypothetical protein
MKAGGLYLHDATHHCFRGRDHGGCAASMAHLIVSVVLLAILLARQRDRSAPRSHRELYHETSCSVTPPTPLRSLDIPTILSALTCL